MAKLLIDPFNIIICGIGGQGNILASELLGSALVECGYKVSIGETYGASQRGGSVMSHIRVSADKDLGVLIAPGEANLIVGFEPLETLRMVREYGNKNTTVIYDPRAAYPLGVLIGESIYPSLETLDDEIRKRSKDVYVVPAAQIALDLGNAKAANIALMGALTALDQLPLVSSDYAVALEQRFEGKILEMNRLVFDKGHDSLAAQL